MTRQDRIAALKQAAKERVLILDGSWGVMIQRENLSEDDFRAERFKDHPDPLKGNNDLLNLTRPDIVLGLHDAYYAAGADISETNTFSSTVIAQADYGLQSAVRDLNLEAARLGRESADRWTEKEPHKPRFLAGAIGPLNRTLSISPDVNNPAARAVTFDEVYAAYREQALALHEGGVDLFLVCHHAVVQRACIERVAAAVESGELPRARFDDARERVRVLAMRFAQGPETGGLEALESKAHLATAQALLHTGEAGHDPTERA